MLTNKSRAGAGGFTYRPTLINHLIEYVDEKLVSDRLQAGGAVVSVGGAGKERVRRVKPLAAESGLTSTDVGVHLKGSCRYWFQLGLGPSAVLV